MTNEDYEHIETMTESEAADILQKYLRWWSVVTRKSAKTSYQLALMKAMAIAIKKLKGVES